MTDIDKLIRMNIELEGLLLVLRERDSIEARDMLSDKIEEYTSALNAFLFAGPQEAPAVMPTVVEDAEEPLVELNDKEDDNDTVFHEDVKEQAEPETAIIPEDKTRLLKAFTLNDRFRFRRELFAGDDQDFHETLNLLADMDCYNEACDYLYNDMMWDRNDPVVKEFMDIVAANMPQ